MSDIGAVDGLHSDREVDARRQVEVEELVQVNNSAAWYIYKQDSHCLKTSTERG